MDNLTLIWESRREKGIASFTIRIIQFEPYFQELTEIWRKIDLINVQPTNYESKLLFFSIYRAEIIAVVL